MVATNMRSTRVQPATSRLLTLRVLRRERLSPGFMRITLGGGDIAGFTPMGHDQWFRLFLPVAGGGLDRVPNKLDMVSYLRFLTISKAQRPILRSFSVRAYRAEGPEGPELDVDFVLHGSLEDGTAGPAVTWAQSCRRGDTVGILDEGVGFSLPEGVDRLRFAADETGVPAAANTLATLPDTVSGQFILEVPTSADRQELVAPPGVEIVWLPRDGRRDVPGRLALAAALDAAAGEEAPGSRPWFGVAVGEQALASGVRRCWVEQGQRKDRVMFCGYWRAGR